MGMQEAQIRETSFLNGLVQHHGEWDQTKEDERGDQWLEKRSPKGLKRWGKKSHQSHPHPNFVESFREKIVFAAPKDPLPYD